MDTAVIQANEGENLTAQEMGEFCAPQLAPYKRPSGSFSTERRAIPPANWTNRPFGAHTPVLDVVV